jgi:hypothetical protein
MRANDGRCGGSVNVAAERTAMEAYDRRGVEGRMGVLKHDDGMDRITNEATVPLRRLPGSFMAENERMTQVAGTGHAGRRLSHR